MSSDQLTSFLDKKYVNLETYRKSGEAVKTPVWFVISNGIIYVVTSSNTGKIKRLKHSDKIRVTPCDFNGKPLGNWIAGKAYLANESESIQAIKLRKEKYGIMERLISIFTGRKGKPVVIGINFN